MGFQPGIPGSVQSSPVVAVFLVFNFPSSFVVWALLKSFKNDFPMVRVIIFRSFSSFFFEVWEASAGRFGFGGFIGE